MATACTPQYAPGLCQRADSGFIQETLDKGGNVVIPSFAVGRTQEMLYFIRKIKADGAGFQSCGFSGLCGQSACGGGNRYFPNKTSWTCFDEEAMAACQTGHQSHHVSGAAPCDHERRIQGDQFR